VSGCRSVHERSIQVGLSDLKGALMAKKAAQPEGLKRLEKKLRPDDERTFTGYLSENFDDFHAVIMRLGVRWDKVAEWAFEEGYKDKNGQPIKPATAKRAYEREANRRKVPKKRAAKMELSAPTQQPSYAPVEAPSVPRERKPLNMTPARPLAPGEAPQDDGSALPKPLGPARK
jgi:hypothetical protein